MLQKCLQAQLPVGGFKSGKKENWKKTLHPIPISKHANFKVPLEGRIIIPILRRKELGFRVGQGPSASKWQPQV